MMRRGGPSEQAFVKIQERYGAMTLCLGKVQSLSRSFGRDASQAVKELIQRSMTVGKSVVPA
eukprot:1356312-Alexandrium_andersonii.AAC.1